MAFVRSILVSSCLVLLVLFCLTSSVHGFTQQIDLEISVTGSLTQNNCSYCDCGGTCNWLTNYYCSSGGFQDSVERWGTPAGTGSPVCFTQSGCGFRGQKNITMTTNPTNDVPTKIGTFIHYNNVIYGGSPSQLRLTLNVTSPQLTDDFIIQFPLLFIETINTGNVTTCDPGIQRTDTDCDDRFSFTSLVVNSTFMIEGVVYTLEMVGFLNQGSSVPIRDITTKENTFTTADVYARIKTYCAVLAKCGGGGGGSSSGLSGGAIGGIVAGGLVALAALTALAVGAILILVRLIRRGTIPGIYGVRANVEGLDKAEQNALYQDVWVTKDNAL